MTPADERRHRPGPDPSWEEAWEFDFVAGDGDALLGGIVRLALLPHRGRARYWASLVGDGRPFVTVVDDEVPLPAAGLELRAEGLWCDHICETPFDHWTLGLEAFAVALDDPAEAWGAGRGDLIALGLDLEWEAARDPQPEIDAYDQACAVVGDVLVGSERLETAGWGWRRHAWGSDPAHGPSWRFTGRLGDGELVRGGGAGSSVGDLLGGEVELPLGRATVLHPAPVAAGAGRLARALVRVRTDEGREGLGWLQHRAP